MHSLVFFLGLLWGTVGATAAERYVVVESRPLTLRAEERAQVFRTIADGLRATGREVAGTQVDGECTTPACWMDAAAAAKATDILVVAGSSERFGWTISLETQERGGQLGVPVQLRLQVLPVCSGDRWGSSGGSKDAERGPGGKVRCDKDAALAGHPSSRPTRCRRFAG